MPVKEVSVYVNNERNTVGIRAHILVMPLVFCVNKVVEKIGEYFKDMCWGEYGENRVVTALHDSGCCHIGFDEEVAERIILGISTNPNVFAVLFVGLGCGQFCTREWKSRLYERSMRNVEHIVVQEEGYEEAIEKGIEIVDRWIKEAMKLRRVKLPLEKACDKMVLGVGNGASDASSGLFANPALGYVSDYFLDRGSSVVFSQTPEVLGAEKVLFKRITSYEELRKMTIREIALHIERYGSIRERKLLKKLSNIIRRAYLFKTSIAEEIGISEPTPGNIRGGLSTLAEKSLGTMYKIGERHILSNILSYGEKVPRNGKLYFMDGPGQDLLSITGMVAGGAQLLVFSTGLGTPVGSIVAPVLKVTANEETYEKLHDIIDLYIPVNEIIQKRIPLKEYVEKEIIPYILQVISGEKSKSEELGQYDFSIRELWMKI